MRTAESVTLTCWPPAPLDRYVSMRRSFSSIADVDVVGQLRPDVERGERRVAARGLVERRDAHQPMDAGLGREQAVGVLARDRQRRALDAGLVAGLRLEQFALEAAALGPAQVHAQDHLGPVLRLGAAGARMHGDDRVLGVVLAAEHLLDLAGLDFGLQLVETAHEIAADVLAGVEPLAQDDEVVGALAQRLQQRDVFVEAPAPLQHLLRRGLVVPEVGRAGLRFEAREFLLGRRRQRYLPSSTARRCRSSNRL